MIEHVKSGLQSFVLEISLDNAPWSDRPVEVDSNQTKTLIEKNQCYSMREIADILKISKPKLLVKMKNVFYFMEKTKWTFCPTQYISLTP